MQVHKNINELPFRAIDFVFDVIVRTYWMTLVAVSLSKKIAAIFLHANVQYISIV